MDGRKEGWSRQQQQSPLPPKMRWRSPASFSISINVNNGFKFFFLSIWKRNLFLSFFLFKACLRWDECENGWFCPCHCIHSLMNSSRSQKDSDGKKERKNCEEEKNGTSFFSIDVAPSGEAAGAFLAPLHSTRNILRTKWCRRHIMKVPFPQLSVTRRRLRWREKNRSFDDRSCQVHTQLLLRIQFLSKAGEKERPTTFTAQEFMLTMIKLHLLLVHTARRGEGEFPPWRDKWWRPKRKGVFGLRRSAMKKERTETEVVQLDRHSKIGERKKKQPSFSPPSSVRPSQRKLQRSFFPSFHPTDDREERTFHWTTTQLFERGFAGTTFHTWLTPPFALCRHTRIQVRRQNN